MSRAEKIYIAVLLTVCASIIVGGIWFKWYRAGIQMDVYRRQGVEMSQWECFMNAEPIERYIK